MSPFTISGFGDEIAADPREQCATLKALGIEHLDLRGAWDRNILDFDEQDVARLKAVLDEHGVRVSLIASPVGKSEIARDASFEEDRITTALRLARALDAPAIRIFSFFLTDSEHAARRDEVIRRLRSFASRAEEAGCLLLLENEAHIWGDTPERCKELVEAVGSPALRLSFDCGNFVSVGYRPFDQAYPILRPYTTHVQIKDVRVLPDGRKTVLPGDGDAQIPQIIRALWDDSYRGFLSLEPHLLQAGRFGGFSGPDLFGQAALALQRIVTQSAPG